LFFFCKSAAKKTMDVITALVSSSAFITLGTYIYFSDVPQVCGCWVDQGWMNWRRPHPPPHYHLQRQLVKDPQLALQMWKGAYKVAATLAVVFCLLATGSGVVAYIRTKQPLWLVGAVLAGTPMPYTAFALMPVSFGAVVCFSTA
jgi:hypothetical protein